MDALLKCGFICTTRRAATCGLLLLYLCEPASNAVAADSAFAIETGVGHTDNIGRTAIDQQGSVIGTVGTLFSFSDVTRRFEANVAGNLEYQSYSASSYPGQIIGAANAQGKFVIIPEQFEWKFSDYFGQTTRDQAEAITPNNRENINYFSTGPLLKVRLGSSMNRLTMEGTYSEVSYQYSDLSNQRYQGAIGLERELSAASSVSLNFQSGRVVYQDAMINPPINQQEAFIQYQAATARTTLGLDVGYAHVKQLATTLSRPVFGLNVTRKISLNTTLSLFLNRQTADSGSLFQILQTSLVSNQTTQVVQPQNEPFTSTYVGILWGLRRPRSSLELSVTRYKDSYQTLSQYDQTRTVAHGDFERQLSPTLQIYTTVDLWKSMYAAQFGDTTDRVFVVGAAKRLGRRLSLDFQFDRLDRSAAEVSNASKVNEIWVRLFYGSSVVGGGSLASRAVGSGLSTVH